MRLTFLVAVLGSGFLDIIIFTGRLYAVRRPESVLTSERISLSRVSSSYLEISSSAGTITAAISSVPSFAPNVLEIPRTHTSAKYELFSRTASTSSGNTFYLRKVLSYF